MSGREVCCCNVGRQQTTFFSLSGLSRLIQRNIAMKTTTLGILTILCAVLDAAKDILATGNADLGVVGTAIVAGLGLIRAADSK